MVAPNSPSAFAKASTLPATRPGQASGAWVNDRTHGLQFRAAFLRSAPPTTLEGIEKYLASGMIRGIGPVYAKKMVNPSLDKDELHQSNATDIYNSLSELKGSALKVAQMMSMDKNLLPRAYQDKFTMAQYSAPPLSYPLVVKTFQKYFGKTPESLFVSITR